MLTPPPAHLSPAGLDIIFHIHTGSNLSLTGVTLQNGKGKPDARGYYDGAITVEGHLDATSCSFKNNHAVRGGGVCACAATYFSSLLSFSIPLK
jgi:hypothetical protein